MNDLDPTTSPLPTGSPDPAPVVLQTAPPAVTPGIRTTEFWSHAFVVASCVIGAVTGVLPAKAALITAGVASGCYAISRALTKVGGNLW